MWIIDDPPPTLVTNIRVIGMERIREFVASLHLEKAAEEKTIEVLETEQVMLKQLLDGSVSMIDLEEAGVPAEVLGKLEAGSQVDDLTGTLN